MRSSLWLRAYHFRCSFTIRYHLLVCDRVCTQLYILVELRIQHTDRQLFIDAVSRLQQKLTQGIEDSIPLANSLVNLDGPKSNVFKILVVGDTAVGKTSFLHRYLHNSFTPNYISTISVEFGIKEVNWHGTTVRLQFWVIMDTAHSLTPHAGCFWTRAIRWHDEILCHQHSGSDVHVRCSKREHSACSAPMEAALRHSSQHCS